jgi:hypothetical protein
MSNPAKRCKRKDCKEAPLKDSLYCATHKPDNIRSNLPRRNESADVNRTPSMSRDQGRGRGQVI